MARQWTVRIEHLVLTLGGILLLVIALPSPGRCDVTVLYDSGGFEGFATGSLVSAPQDGWTGYAIDGALDPEIVDAGAGRCVRLSVPDGDPPLDHRKESRVVKSFPSPLYLAGMTQLEIECDLTLDADGDATRQNVYFDFDPHPNKWLPDAQIVQDGGYVQMVRGGNQQNGIGAAGNGTYHMSWTFDLQAGTVTTRFGTTTIDNASAVALPALIGNQPGEDPDGNPNTLDAVSFALASDFWAGPGDAVTLDNFVVRGDPQPIPAPEVSLPRTVLLSYDPILESQGGARLHAYAGWGDPDTLTRDYLADLRASSHGCLVPRWTQSIPVDAFPLKEDGFRYTDETYLNGLQGGGWHDPDGVDYKSIIRDFDLARRADRGEIDEVVIHGAPYFGYYESRMAGRGGYWCNSPPQQRIAGDKIVILMGLNYERGVGEEIHSFGHRSESILSRTYGGWDITQSRHDWERFTHNIGQSGDAACGSVHWPPNAATDYDYANPTPVVSTAIDWEQNFPNLTGQTSMVDAETWGGPDYQRNFLNWWFGHMPHVAGSNTHDGLARWNSWWPYIADLNRWPESGGLQPRGGLPPPATPLEPYCDAMFFMNGDSWGPRGSGNGFYVWYGHDGHDYEIYATEGDMWGIPVTNNDHDDEAPAVNASRQVVWQGFDGQDYEIFTYDPDYGTVQVTSNAQNDWHPQINNAGRIVWDGFDGDDYEIFSANVDGTGLTRITDNSSTGGRPRDDVWPQINDAGRVVWYGWDGENWEIFSAGCDGTALVNVSNNSYENEYPQIGSTGRVVWHAWLDDQNSEIFSARCTGGTVSRLTDTSEPDWYPQVNDQARITWMAMDPTGDWEIMTSDSTGADVDAITNNNSHDEYPVIDEYGRIIWQGMDGNDWEIYLWQEGQVRQLTDNDVDDYGPTMRHSQMTWTSADGDPGPPHQSVVYLCGGLGMDVEEPAAENTAIRLERPNPNPGSETTRLAYWIPRAGDVALVVVDAAGRVRARLVNGRMDAGRHEILWPGDDGAGHRLASGVYFLRMSALGQTESERLLLVR